MMDLAAPQRWKQNVSGGDHPSTMWRGYGTDRIPVEWKRGESFQAMELCRTVGDRVAFAHTPKTSFLGGVFPPTRYHTVSRYL